MKLTGIIRELNNTKSTDCSRKTKNVCTDKWKGKSNSNEKLDTKESKRLWRNIWGEKVDHTKMLNGR